MLGGDMVADRAASGGAQNGVVVRQVTSDPAHDGALKAAAGVHRAPDGGDGYGED
jgi:hypothetical protein